MSIFFYKTRDQLQYTPLTYELPKHTAIEFKLKVKNALDVQVIDLHTQRWTRLTRYNNLFMGRVNIGSSPVVVVAQFAKDSKYLTLLQYR